MCQRVTIDIVDGARVLAVLCDVCPARLPHRLFHCCRGLLVRVEKLLGDFEHAKLIVASEDLVVL